MTSLDEFKIFLKKHPLLREEVKDKKRTWQDIYEEWVLFKDDESWNKYQKTDETLKKEEIKKEDPKEEKSDDIVKTIMGYVKKINPDTITKYVSSIQKVIELMGVFSAGGLLGSQNKKNNTSDPLFDRKLDEWY